jgi:predicted AlkP superfamily pyrophosphatase or phosphodiesterase
MRILRHAFALLCLMLSSTLASYAQKPTDTTQQVIAGRKNSPEQQKKPYLILISADGFRHDYAKKYHASNILNLANNGISARSMRPSYPSLTFPNHYSIVTGLYPSHHGLVDNFLYDSTKKDFYRTNGPSVRDSSWYGGTPIWVLAEQQQLLSATFYWVGSEAAIQGIRPTYSYKFNKVLTLSRRVEIVRDWLRLPREIRPHLITFYMGEADHAAHEYGTGSPQLAQAVRDIDQCIGAMKRMTDSLGLEVNYIFLSDHGMADVDTRKTPELELSSIIDTSRFAIAKGSNILMQLYAKDKKDIAPAFSALKKSATGYKAYLKGNTPRRWQYDTKHDRSHRIGDIFLAAENRRMLPFEKKGKNPGIYGAHGYDNSLVDMQASFYAWGPAFGIGIKVGNFENVDIYPLMVQTLNLRQNEVVDGKVGKLLPILARP